LPVTCSSTSPTIAGGEAAGNNQFKSEVGGIPATSKTQAASLLNVSRDTVKDARKILNEGTKDEIGAVERHSVSVESCARMALLHVLAHYLANRLLDLDLVAWFCRVA
jgi:hypothetical protein